MKALALGLASRARALQRFVFQDFVWAQQSHHQSDLIKVKK